MKYIKILPNENGSHQNQFGGGFPGEGWAIIPENITIPLSFPFVDIEVENGYVIAMTAREVPPIPLTPPSTEEIIYITLLDHEERICLMELGVEI